MKTLYAFFLCATMIGCNPFAQRQWEYKSITVLDVEFEAVVNDASHDGWQVVSVERRIVTIKGPIYGDPVPMSGKDVVLKRGK